MLRQLLKTLILNITLLVMLMLSTGNIHAQVTGVCGQPPVTDANLRCPQNCPRESSFLEDGTPGYICGYVRLSCGQRAYTNAINLGIAQCGCQEVGSRFTEMADGIQCCGNVSGGNCVNPINPAGRTQGTCGQDPVQDETLLCPSACPRMNINHRDGTQSYFCGYTNLSCGESTNAQAVAEGIQRCDCSATAGAFGQMSDGRQCCGLPDGTQCLNPATAQVLSCGRTISERDSATAVCNCPGASLVPMSGVAGVYCCGTVIGGNSCAAPEISDSFDASEELTQTRLNQLNPFVLFGNSEVNANQLSTPGSILSRVLVFAFPLAGLILFVMLLWAGFEIVMGASNSKSIEAGKQRATTAVAGFALLFISYWIIQIVEVVFAVTIF